MPQKLTNSDYYRLHAAERRAAAKPETPGEEWRDVVGWEGVYEVSSLARVRRVGPARSAVVWHVLKPRMPRHGYPMVSLSRNQRKRHCLIHRLVAEAFLGPALGRVVNHIDMDKANPLPENLEWVTQRENLSHARAHGLAPKQRRGKLTDDDVRRIRAARSSDDAALAAVFGLGFDFVRKIRLGRYYRHVPSKP